MKKKTLPRYRTGKPTTYLSSLKNKRTLWFDSKLERDYAMVKEFDLAISRYLSQPISFMPTEDNEIAERYTPDFLSEYRGTECKFEEVKRDQFADHPDFKAKFADLKRHARDKHGIALELVRESDIRSGARISNLDRLYNYKRVPLAQEAIEDTLAGLPATVSLKKLLEKVQSLKLRSVIAFALVAQKHLWFDETKPLTGDTCLEVTQ